MKTKQKALVIVLNYHLLKVVIELQIIVLVFVVEEKRNQKEPVIYTHRVGSEKGDGDYYLEVRVLPMRPCSSVMISSIYSKNGYGCYFSIFGYGDYEINIRSGSICSILAFFHKRYDILVYTRTGFIE